MKISTFEPGLKVPIIYFLLEIPAETSALRTNTFHNYAFSDSVNSLDSCAIFLKYRIHNNEITIEISKLTLEHATRN